jgi:predicted nucleotidyltransferase component of viral defense system
LQNGIFINMTLHENIELFRQAILATSQRLQMAEIYVEKDYWVTAALHKIFHSKAASYSVFKGGTALSKAHRLIDRFSEDIDLVVIPSPGDSSNQLKNKLRSVTAAVTELLPEIEVAGVTNKRGMIRKTAHVYKKMGVSGIYGQVRETIILETTWLGTSDPHIPLSISSYIADMMMSAGQEMLMQQYTLAPFTVHVLSKERTFCEKIMSLVRFSLTEAPYRDLANKIRHVYDLHMMLKNPEIRQFLASTDFDRMLIQVGTDDKTSFKNNNGWLAIHPAKTIIFNDPTGTWPQIRSTYQATFKDLVIGILPVEEELVGSLQQIGERLGTVTWNIMG